MQCRHSLGKIPLMIPSSFSKDKAMFMKQSTSIQKEDGQKFQLLWHQTIFQRLCIQSWRVMMDIGTIKLFKLEWYFIHWLNVIVEEETFHIQLKSWLNSLKIELKIMFSSQSKFQRSILAKEKSTKWCHNLRDSLKNQQI